VRPGAVTDPEPEPVIGKLYATPFWPAQDDWQSKEKAKLPDAPSRIALPPVMLAVPEARCNESASDDTIEVSVLPSAKTKLNTPPGTKLKIAVPKGIVVAEPVTKVGPVP
jgi:hypothetical protein